MKNWNRFFAAILTTALVAGCGKDNPGNNNVDPEDSKKAAYMSISVALPSAKSTRSETENGGGSTGGTEIGQDKENNVKKILLLLANEDNTFGTSCTVENLSVDPGKSTVKPTAKIMRTELRKFYDSDGNLNDKAKNGIRVYVFCNPTDELITAIEGTDYGNSDWTDKICQVLQSQTSTGSKNIAIWADNSFLMSNAASALRQIPSNFETWRVNHDTEYNAFDLSGLNNGEIDNLSNGRGSIKVERSVARFDFKDGSSTNNNTYDIGLGEQKGQLQVKLYRMALVNMSQNFYYLRRVSDDGKGRNKELCGSETPNNYVDDTDADFKTAANLPPATLKGHFNYPLFDNNGQITEDTRKQWDNYWIDDVLASQEDHKDYTKAGYHIWRYVTENTIPQDDDKQRNGITTGVVFKGKLIAGNGLETANQDLYNAIQGTYNLPEGTQGYTYDIDGKTYPVLYVFQNMIYTGWNAGVAPAAEKAGETSDLYKAYFNAPEGSSESPNALYQKLVAAKGQSNEESVLNDFRKAATSAGFTLYQASDDAQTDAERNAGVGYYFYYYYWNRHNDNEQPGTMGPMEFAVVRNNVYKLAVTGIAKLGHPRITGNDPDPVDPDDPNEKGDAYLTVSVEVLPWVVRENNIEF